MQTNEYNLRGTCTKMKIIKNLVENNIFSALTKAKSNLGEKNCVKRAKVRSKLAICHGFQYKYNCPLHQHAETVKKMQGVAIRFCGGLGKRNNNSNNNNLKYLSKFEKEELVFFFIVKTIEYLGNTSLKQHDYTDNNAFTLSWRKSPSPLHQPSSQ